MFDIKTPKELPEIGWKKRDSLLKKYMRSRKIEDKKAQN